MLAPMNPPPFEYKPYAHHAPPTHHSGGANAMHLEPQHDDLAHAHYGAASHHHGFGPSWSNHAVGSLAFGAFDHHGHDDDDHDDHDHDDDHDDDHDEHEPETPTGADPSTAKRKARGGTGKAGGAKHEVFVCPEVHCGKTFPRSFALRRHMRIHTGTKPYACDVDGCAQRFNTSGNLSRHKRIHSGERPYPCVFASCGKRFNTSTKLKRHMRIHFPDGQSLFHCVQHACAFACDNYKEYVHHQRQHGNPMYAPPPKTATSLTDENADPSNAATSAKPKHGRATTKGAAKTKRVAPAPAQSRVSKASKAAAAATTAALTGDYLSDRRFADHHHHHHASPSTSAASAGLSMLLKEAHHRDDMDSDYLQDHRQQRPSALKGQAMDAPARLPFPTGAFPSESIAGASPMNLNLASTFGSTFSKPPPSASLSQAAYYDHPSASSSSFPSYLRGGASDMYGQQQQHHQHQQHPHHGHPSSSYHDSVHFPPLRPEDGGDDDYDSSPRHRHHHQQPQHAHHHHHGHHSHEQQQQHSDSEDDKYGGYTQTHAVGSDFTGEELSAVLELMKDS